MGNPVTNPAGPESGHPWPVAVPESIGVDSDRLATLCRRILEIELPIHSLLVLRHGRVAADITFHPFAGGLHDLASCTKSVTSTLIGIAIDQGAIAGVDAPVLDLLPGRPVANVDDRKRALTLAHLLTMSTGLACYANPGEITLQEMRRSDDWAQFVLDLRMIENPGARFEYCSPASYLLSVILQQATGRTALDFAREHLFGPLGIEDVVWPPSPQGVTTGWGDLHLTPRDMAKIGMLFLHQGRYDGRQIVSREWVAAATRKHAAPPGHFGYGYGWWLASPDVYAANGRGGQQIIVAPALDAVAVLTAGLSPEQGGVRDELIDSLLLPALRSDADLPANPAGAGRLRDVTQEARQPRDDPRPPRPIPTLAHHVDGHEYRLDANPFGLRAFSLSLVGGAEARLRLLGSGPPTELRIGLDNVPRSSATGRVGLPAACRGGWQAGDVFTVDWDEIGSINRWRISLSFHGDEVRLDMTEATGLGAVAISGRRS